jgi:dolichol-phosphate mannosyltransferase
MDASATQAWRWRAAFFAVLGSVVLFRAWFATTLPLSGDESYHWQWSRHLAWGYYDHPGLTAYLIRLATWLAGASTELSVRLPALSALTGTAILVFAWARSVSRRRGASRVEAEQAGFLAGMMVVWVPVLAALSVYMSTDPPLLFFYTLALFLYDDALETGAWCSWLAAGAATGLAALSKFLAFFLAPTLLLFLVLSPRDRVWLRRPHVYVAAAVALIVFAPFLAWNATHGWATFTFNFDLRQDRSLAPIHLPEYALWQALALSPGVFVVALWALRRAFGSWRAESDRALLFLGLASTVPLLYFLYESLRQPVAVHWPAAGWIGTFVVASCLLASGQTPRRWRRFGSRSLWLAASLALVLHAALHVPPRWLKFSWSYSEERSIIDTGRLNERYGWRELGAWVSDVRAEMTQRRGRDVFVIAAHYAMVSHLAFYTPEQIDAHLWSMRRVHGESYRFWDDYPSLAGMNAIFVAKYRGRVESALPKLREHFAEVGELESLPIYVDGEDVRTFTLVRCYGFDGREPRFE